jgi:hypothetical protein
VLSEVLQLVYLFIHHTWSVAVTDRQEKPESEELPESEEDHYTQCFQKCSNSFIYSYTILEAVAVTDRQGKPESEELPESEEDQTNHKDIMI